MALTGYDDEEFRRQAHRDVRHLSSGLMLSTMSDDGLLTALRATASETQDRFGITCEIRCEPFDESLIGDSRLAVAMPQIAREAIHNNGVGFSDGANLRGSGPRIMRYRAESIGAA